jgi:5-methylcytosine-specific restriction enzyme subunit McrC
MRSLHLTEYVTQAGIPLTRSEALFLRENYRNHLYITPSFHGKGLYDITPQHYVGHLTLLTGRTLSIHPKFNLNNLFYFLTYAYDLIHFKRDTVAYKRYQGILEFLVKIFVELMGDLIQKGLYKTFLTQEGNHRFIRGKILFPTHFKENQWRKDRVYCQYTETTSDVPENQILKFTTFLLATQLHPLKDLTKRLQTHYHHLSEVSWTPIQVEDLHRVVYHRLNRHYRTVLSLCELFLQSITIQNHPGDVNFFSFLLDMNQLFERFIAGILREKLSVYPSLSMSYQESRWLDREKSRNFIPDFILYKKDKPVLVLDTKYKQRNNFIRTSQNLIRSSNNPEELSGTPLGTSRWSPDPEDLYQILTYCYSLDVKTGIFLYPTPGRWHIETWKGITIQAWGIDLQQTPQCLENDLEAFFKEILAIIHNL